MTDRRIQVIERVLGLAKETGKEALPMRLPYDEGYGPARTLLDINYDLAPGYHIYDSKNQPVQGNEPERTAGDVFVQRFPSDRSVLAVPIYLIAEQVAQIMRYIQLPDDYIVELEAAKPFDPREPDDLSDYNLEKGGVWPRPTKLKNGGLEAYTQAFEDRADGTLSLLPGPDLEDGVQRLQRRQAERVERRPDGEWPAEVLRAPEPPVAMELDGVDGTAFQDVFERDVAVAAQSPELAVVPQGGEPAFVEEERMETGAKRRRETSPPPPTMQLVQPTAFNSYQVIPAGDYLFDPAVVGFLDMDGPGEGFQADWQVN